MRNTVTFVAPSGTLPCRDCHIMPQGESTTTPNGPLYAIICRRCGTRTEFHADPRHAIAQWRHIQTRSERN